MATVEATEPRPQDWLERTLSKGVAVNAELLIYLALVVAAVLTRFYDVGARAISHDETTHVYYSWNLYTGRGFEPNPLMHGPLLFHLTAFSYYLFGDNDVAAHVPFALAGVAAVALVWVFRKWLGRTGTLVAAAMMLVSPFMLFYSRYIRQEATIIVEGMLMFWAVFRYFETRRSRWLYLLAFALALHFTDKSTSFIYTAQLMIFLGAMLAWQLARGEWERPRLKVAFLLGLASALVGMAAAGAAFIGERAGAATNAATTQAPVNPTGAAVGVVSELSPVVGMGILLAVVGGALMAIALLMAYGKRLRTEFPALDVILLTGTFVLPQLAAFPARMLGWDPIAYTDPSAMQRTGIMVAILAAVSLLIGLAWDWRRWVIASGIFWGIFVTFYTTLFTYGPGFFTGIVGMLGYWLVQQGVNRGSQPWYYYSFLQIPIYEFLPAVGALMAFAMGLSGRPDNEPAAADAATGQRRGRQPQVAGLSCHPVPRLLVDHLADRLFAGRREDALAHRSHHAGDDPAVRLVDRSLFRAPSTGEPSAGARLAGCAPGDSAGAGRSARRRLPAGEPDAVPGQRPGASQDHNRIAYLLGGGGRRRSGLGLPNARLALAQPVPAGGRPCAGFAVRIHRAGCVSRRLR